MNNKKIVCLGGGIGTVNLLKGLKNYCQNITTIVSMADDGGSTGRLRRLYNIMPPGDLVSCMAARLDDKTMAKLLTYRFPGDRYGKDNEIVGQKLGNLIMVGMRDITGNFADAVLLFQKTFKVPGVFYPATSDQVSISAKTIEGKEVHREENIDLGRYVGKKAIDHVLLHPKNAKTSPGVLNGLKNADVIIVGPGDLYTTILPSLIIPEISEEVVKSKKEKVFIVNIANKPTETKGYSVLDYIKAIEKHLGTFPFTKVIVNTDFSIPIPARWRKNYTYVPINDSIVFDNVSFIKENLVSNEFPLYHDSDKLAKTVLKSI